MYYSKHGNGAQEVGPSVGAYAAKNCVKVPYTLPKRSHMVIEKCMFYLLCTDDRALMDDQIHFRCRRACKRRRWKQGRTRGAVSGTLEERAALVG